MGTMQLLLAFNDVELALVGKISDCFLCSMFLFLFLAMGPLQDQYTRESLSLPCSAAPEPGIRVLKGLPFDNGQSKSLPPVRLR